MLATFRNQKKLLSVFLWLVIAAFIGTIFLVWGVGDSQKQSNFAIKVNEIEIGFPEYKNSYEQTSQTLRQLFGNQMDQLPDLDIGKQVRTELINKYLLLEEATKMKIPVSNAEVLAEIVQIPSFQVDGEFSKARYHDVLKANRINATSFEANIKQDILLRKITSITKSAVLVTDKEIENEFIFRNTSASVSFIVLEGKDFQKNVKIDNDKFKSFFDVNKEDYKVPAKIKVKYVTFDPANFNDNVTVSNDDIETYYINHKVEFDNPETVTAQHIIVNVANWSDNASVTAAKKKIDSILKKVNSGKDFTKLAKEFSEGPSATNGGDLGTFQKGEMVKEFETVAFSLEDGKSSNVIKSPYGFHIIKVNKHTLAKQLTIDEAKATIIKNIEATMVKSTFRNHVLKTYKQILDASNISAFIGTGNKLSVVETEFFSATDSIYPLGNDQRAKTSLFRLQSTEISNIITIKDKQYIFEIMDKKDAFIPELSKITNTVKKDFVKSEGAELAEKRAMELIAKDNIKKISKITNIPYSTTPEFNRLAPIPVIGPDSDLSNTIFNTEEGKLLSQPFRSNGTSYIISVNEIKKPEMSELAGEKEAIEGYILNTKQDEAFRTFLNKLTKAATIEINPSITE